MFSKLRNKILLIIVVLALLIIPCVVSASNSIEVFNVAESSGNTYSQLPIIATVNNNQLVFSGLISSSGLNSQVALSGITVPRMLTDSTTLFVSNILANTSNDFIYGTKDTPDTSMPIIVGNGGYITTADTAALEPGTAFSIVANGYLDTTAGASKNIISKAGALSVYVAPTTSGTVNALIPSYSTLLTTTSAFYTYYSQPLWAQTFTTTSTTPITQAELYCVNTAFTSVVVGLYATSAGAPTGTPLVTSNPTNGSASSWVSIPFTAPYTPTNSTVYAVVVMSGTGGWGWANTNPYAGGKMYSVTLGGSNNITGTTPYAANDFELKVDTNPWLQVAGVSSGVHTITVSETAAAGGTFSLQVDAGAASTVTSAGSVPDNGNAWVIDQSNVMPYMTYYTETVGGTEVVKYQPATIIIGTALPNLDSGGLYPGVITFGSNPAGITVTNKSLPTINTVSAINPTTSSVTLNANLTSLGAYSSASVWFDYGTDTSYGDSTSNVSYSAQGVITPVVISTLIPNTTYHFRAAVSPDGLAADASYGSDMTFSTVLSTTTSKTIKINAVGLFPNYKDAGDLLVVAEVYCDWSGLSPASDPSQNFVLQLKDPTNTDIIAQDPLLQWGDRPEAIYLSPSLASTLTPDGAYYIVLAPTFTVGAPTAFSEQVTAEDWTQDLYTWCIGVAKDMASYDQVATTNYVVTSTDNNEVITDTAGGSGTGIGAGGYFTTGIPQISTVLPKLFQVTESQVEPTIGGSNDQWTPNHTWTTKVGSLIASDFGVIGNLFFGDTNHGQVVMGYMLLFIVLLICIFGVMLGGKGLPLLVLSFPITVWGAEMGAIAYQWLLIPCIAMVLLWARQFWVKPT